MHMRICNYHCDYPINIPGGEMSHSNKGIFAMRRSDFEATLRKACDDAVKYLDEHRSENSQGIDAATIYEIIIRKLEHL